MRLLPVAMVCLFSASAFATACGSVETNPNASGTTTGGVGGGHTATSSTSQSTSGTTGDSTSTGVVDAGPDIGVPSDVYPAKHSAPPKVVTLGGPTMTKPVIVPVYFNNDDKALTDKVTDFANKVGQTPYWKANVAEYGVAAATGAPPVQLAEDAPDNIGAGDIDLWLAKKLNDPNNKEFPAPDSNTLFMIIYPPTTSINQGGQGGVSCVNFGGYHTSVQLDAAHNNLAVAYAVVPQCADFDGFSGIDAVTAGGSHELVEAVTDPHPQTEPAFGQVDTAHIYWLFALGGGETGDMCAQNLTSFYPDPDVGYVVQRCWSNKAVQAGHDPCVPSPVGQVYFNAAPVLPDSITLSGGGQSIKVKGAHIPVGESKTIDVQLFSDGPTGGDFNVTADDFSQITGGPSYLDLNLDADSGQNGQTLHLTITVNQASKYKSEIFVLTSELNGVQNSWLGIVGN
jgi:hypothetical protein